MLDEAKVDGLVAELQKAENTAAEMLREVKMVIFTLPRGLNLPKRSFSCFRGV
jgi:hypothetical protein